MAIHWLKAQVQVWENRYNQKTYNYEDIKAELYSTDETGFFKLKDAKEYRNFNLQIRHNGDEPFMLDESNYAYYNGLQQTRAGNRIRSFFTDRSIYRPGQTVSFKGIVVKADTNISRTGVLPGYKTTVLLHAMPMARKPLRLMLRAMNSAASTALSGCPRAY